MGPWLTRWGPRQTQNWVDSGPPCWLLVLEVLEVWEVPVVPAGVLVEEILAGDLEVPVAAAVFVESEAEEEKAVVTVLAVLVAVVVAGVTG